MELVSWITKKKKKKKIGTIDKQRVKESHGK